MTLIKTVLQSLFGKDRTAIWQQFAVEKNGKYIVPWSDHKVVIQRKNVSITIDNYYYHPSIGNATDDNLIRGIAEFVSADHYKLTITQQGVLENISKIFGAQDIRIGEQPFDKTFMVKSNDETKTQMLLSNQSITQLLLENDPIRVEITDEDGLWNERPAKGKFMLYVVCEGPVKDIMRLNEFYLLMTEMLDRIAISVSGK